jgi:hypothetical protein
MAMLHSASLALLLDVRHRAERMISRGGWAWRTPA